MGSPLNQTVTAEVAFASIDGSYSKVLGPWIPDAGNYQYTGHNGLNGTISKTSLEQMTLESDPSKDTGYLSSRKLCMPEKDILYG